MMSLSTQHPKAVCFDLYGTLLDISVDTRPPEIWETLAGEARRIGIAATASELHDRYDRLVTAERREHGQPFVLDGLFFFKLLSWDGKRLDAHQVHLFGRRFRDLSTRSLELKPYALELLTTLRTRGCKLGLVSNTEETVTSHDLNRTGLRSYFEAIILSSVIGIRKPEPRIFHIALQRLSVSASECVFVGDDYECDYNGARRAGLRPVLLCNGNAPHENCVSPRLSSILRAIA